ncbi:sulfotransferase, partial [bacterium]|nr:sulfotransferase [bacterium]
MRSDKVSRKPILVTGPHRSGTTWVGKILSVIPSIGYIHEPFNPLHRRSSPGICKAKFKYQYTYVTEENESEFYEDILTTINFRYNLLLQIREVIKKRQGFRTLFRQYSGFLINRYIHHARPLFKDPMALFSTEWPAKRFNMDVVILIRHPAAFISSVKRMNWPQHDFSQFLKQPLLMRDHLYPFEKEIKELVTNKHDVIDEGILLWKMFYYVVD